MMRVLLIGFGNVGRELASILAEKSRYPGLTSLPARVVGIVTRTHGSVVSPDGIDLGRALRQVREGGRLDPHDATSADLDAARAVASLDYDVLVELSVLSIEQRGEPALSLVRSALERGRHVVTANKGPVAFGYPELSRLARDQDRAFLFESTVMDGAPVFGLARESLQGCKVEALSGILNSTTNFVIERMEAGVGLEAAVAEAQREGVAEADPAHDLEGWDAAAKLSILCRVLMDAPISPLQVERTGIRQMDAAAPKLALQDARRVKLACRAWRTREGVRATVAPEWLDGGDPLAGHGGFGSILRLETDLMGPLLIRQENPTVRDTAYGVLNDLMVIGAAR